MIKKYSFAGRWAFIKKLELKPALPENLIIDPTPGICNLHCPLCPTGAREIKLNKVMLRLETFEKIIEKVHSAKNLMLFSWGESFLNPEICEMIKKGKEKGLNIFIHSNFSLPLPDEFFEKLVQSGLDDLTLSIDGATQENYEKYRRGGNIELIYSNIRKLVAAKKKLGSDKPKITWKFVVNRFNENEIEKGMQLAAEFGIGFKTTTITLVDDVPDLQFTNYSVEKAAELIKEWMPSDKHKSETYIDASKRFPLYKGHCTFLWDTIIINPDGAVFPCCWASDQKSNFGNIFENTLEEIWYNDQYIYSRNLFTKEESPLKLVNICTRCENFERIR